LLFVMALFVVGSAYLWCPVPLDGDGAVYEAQVRFGSPGERSIHAGWLAPTWLLHRLLGWPPQIFAVIWGGVALLLATALGRDLLAVVPRDVRSGPSVTFEEIAPVLAPATLLAAAATWRATGTVEVYGPLAAVLLGVALACARGRPAIAGVLLAWGATMHPGAWLIAPGLLLYVGADRRSAIVVAVIAAVLQAVALAILWPDWWSGPRGLLAAAPADQGPWRSLKAAWRLLARDLGPAALPLLLGVAALPGRRAAGVGLMVLGVALTDRWSDNPAHLPVLWLAAAAAPLTVRWWDALESERLRRLGAAGLVALMLLGLAESTTRHDAAVRRAEREAAAFVDVDCEALPWRDRVRCDLHRRRAP